MKQDIRTLTAGLKRFLSERRSENELLQNMMEALESLSSLGSEINALELSRDNARVETEKAMNDLGDARSTLFSEKEAIDKELADVRKTTGEQVERIKTGLCEAKVTSAAKLTAMDVALVSKTEGYTSALSKMRREHDKLMEKNNAELDTIRTTISMWLGKLNDAKEAYRLFKAGI